MTSNAPGLAIKVTTLAAGACAVALTYWIWRGVLGIPLELSTSIHMDDPAFRMRPWAPSWVAPLIVGVLVMGFWRVLVARRGGISMKSGVTVMTAAVPVAFGVSFMCLNYGAMMQSPLVSFASLVEMTPLVAMEGLSLAGLNLMFHWILLVPAAVAGLVIAGIGRLCAHVEQQRGSGAQMALSPQQDRGNFGRRVVPQTAVVSPDGNGSRRPLRLALAAAGAFAFVCTAAGIFWFAQAAHFGSHAASTVSKENAPRKIRVEMKGADSGHPDKGNLMAQFNLGLVHEKGRGVTQDYAEAAKWYRQAAEQGFAPAQNNLGNLYAQGFGVAKDSAEAFKWHLKAAERGHAPAQANVALDYEKGLGTAKDQAQAVEWYRKAAGQGHAQAQTRLGLAYQNGRGVDQDYAQAVEWYRKAADQGHALAQNNLAVMYARGWGVTKDNEQSLKWLRMAAEQGDSLAQVNLGNVYANGAGVPQDYAEAAKWYRKAADQGNSMAQSKLESLPAEKQN